MWRNINQQVFDRQKQGQQFSNQIKNLRILAEQGDPKVMFAYGWCLLFGEGVPKNESLGADYIRRSAEKGFENAKVLYATCQLNGWGVAINKQKALEVFLEYANKGNADAQFNYAIALEHGMGIRKNADQALYWYRKAAQQNHVFSQARVHEIERNQKELLQYEQINISSWIINENDYSIVRKIGEGGFGSVYKVLKKSNEEFFALKTIKSDDGKNKLSSKVEREIKILIGLKHPCVLNLKGIIIPANTNEVKILTKYYENGSLQDVLNQIMDGKYVQWWNHNSISKIIIGIVNGMRYVHQRGIIHHDLKPDNILLDINHNPVICDFGISHFADIVQSMIRYGTCGYMAPEVYDSRNCDDESVDVFSFGVLLYEILYGKKAFDGNSSTISTNVRNGYRPQLEINSNTKLVNKMLLQILSDCWNSNTEKRPSFKTIFEFLEMIDFKIYSDVDVDYLRKYADEIDPDKKIQLNWQH